MKYLQDNILARHKALYKATPWPPWAPPAPTWPKALKLIEVDYEVLTPVSDVLEAMREGAPSCTTT